MLLQNNLGFQENMPAIDQGVTRDRYMLIPRVLIFVRRGEHFLLLKGAPNKRLWANRYNGIGGHLEQGEDYLSAAQRELLEESGLSVDLHLCGMVVVETKENPGVGIAVFTGEYHQGEVKPSSEGSLEWVSLSSLAGLPMVEDLPFLLKRIQKMKDGDPPFSARSYYDVDQKLVMKFTN